MVDMGHAISQTSGDSPFFKKKRRVCCQKENVTELTIKQKSTLALLGFL